MAKKISLRENLKRKEVNYIKKILGIVVLALMVGIFEMWSPASAELLVNKENVLFFNDFLQHIRGRATWHIFIHENHAAGLLE